MTSPRIITPFPPGTVLEQQQGGTGLDGSTLVNGQLVGVSGGSFGAQQLAAGAGTSLDFSVPGTITVSFNGATAGALLAANNLSDVASPASSRTNLGLGTSAVFNVGTAANNIVQLTGAAKLPAVDGSLLTNLPPATLPDFTDTLATAAPNATIPVATFSATNAAAAVDIAIVTKGNGALLANVPDNAATGGNKRGTNAIDLQLKRTTNTQVASGTYSVTMGEGNTASGTASYAVGAMNIASSDYASCGGGLNNTASGLYSCIPGGQQASTRGIKGMFAYASGDVTAQGDAQFGLYVLSAQTPAAAVTPLTTDQSGSAAANNQVILPNNGTYGFKGTIACRDTGTGNSSFWTFQGVVKRGANAAATALVAAVVPSLVAQDAGLAATVVAVVADTTNGGITINVTGIAATTIKWCATVETTEVTN